MFALLMQQPTLHYGQSDVNRPAFRLHPTALRSGQTVFAGSDVDQFKRFLRVWRIHLGLPEKWTGRLDRDARVIGALKWM